MNKEKFAIIGYGLIGIAAIEHLQHSSKEINPILYILYILGYILLSFEKLKESTNTYSYGHLLLFLLYLINLIWFQNTHHHFLEEKNILLISIILMHFMMITNKYKKYSIFLATIIYTSIGFRLFTNINNKFNLETLKLIGCFFLVVYYLQELFKKKNKYYKIN